MSKKISELPSYIGANNPTGDLPISINGTTYKIQPDKFLDQDLQSVTDLGATTTNPIIISNEENTGLSSFSINRQAIIGNSGNYSGVLGQSSEGVGVEGYSDFNTGVYGQSYDRAGGEFLSSNGKGINVYSDGDDVGSFNLGSSNDGVVINSGTSSTGRPIYINKNGVEKLSVNQEGELSATKIIKSGGTSSQFLMADGSVTTGGTSGDMLKSVYDTDNTGVVDNAEAIKIIGRNSTGSTLYKGTVVYISGSTGNRPNFVKAQANAEATSAGTFGIISADILNNTDGYCLSIGYLDNLDTRTTATHPFTSDTLADGDTIYLSPTTAGYITNVKPYAPNHLVYIGKVTRTSPTAGTIVYRIQNGYELEELHNVNISSVANDDILQFDTASGLWKNESLVNAGIQAIADAKVSDTAYDVTSWDGVTTIAPSKNAVRDILKQLNKTIVLDCPSAIITATTANSILTSYYIPANTFSANDVFKMDMRVEKAGTGGTWTVRTYINSSVSLTGAQLLSTTGLTATNLSAGIYRMHSNRGSLLAFPVTTSAVSDVVATVATSIVTYNSSSDNIYFIISLQMSSATDIGTCNSILIQKG